MSDAAPTPPRSGAMTPERRALLQKLLAQKGLAKTTATGIPPRPADRPVPLSFAQEALWFLEQLESGEATHNQPSAVRLEGPLDREALERALAGIVDRHEPLRTTFAEEGGVPHQVIAPPGGFRLAFEDLSDRPLEEARAEALRLATEEAHRGFDLVTGPLFRAILLRLTESEHVLTLNTHHIITDGWSMGVFTRELQALYDAFRRGEPSPLEPLPAQLGDFAVWQREHLTGDVLEEHLAYWREHLSGELTNLDFPTDRPRPAVQTFRGAHHTVALGKGLSDDLRALARSTGVTPFMTLNAAFLVVLYHTCRKTDVIIGSAIAHRNRKELELMIAFLVNMLVLRTDLSGDPGFDELSKRVQKATLGAWSHQDLPLSRILREVAPDRDLGKNPLFQVQFSLLTPDHNPAVYGYGLSSGEIEKVRLGGMTMTPVDVNYDNARYDVAVFLWDMPQGIHGTIEYARDLFEPETMADLAQRYERVLRKVVAEPRATLSALVADLDAHAAERKAATQEAFKSSMKGRLKSIKRRRAAKPGAAPEEPQP